MWVIIFALIALVVGAMVGYRLGGGNPFAVFLPQTWEHLFDFINN